MNKNNKEETIDIKNDIGKITNIENQAMETNSDDNENEEISEN
jgi:hypothetical protein